MCAKSTPIWDDLGCSLRKPTPTWDEGRVYALGAAGALEAAATVGALRFGVIPPTANFTVADPACDLDVVPNVARRADVECALSNSFAFGGLNAVLAFRKV
jgi:nodulation protein E